MNAKADSQKRRVFIVDDYPLVREWLTNLINQQPDLSVCGDAATAAEALQAINTLNPKTVIVDISLKNSPGLELIKELKEIRPDMNVLVLSMHEEPYYAERALQAGANGYIVKREAARRVIEGIRSVGNGQIFISKNCRRDGREKCGPK
jgi:DNA-binding NarL/FixJ family response regulator